MASTTRPSLPHISTTSTKLPLTPSPPPNPVLESIHEPADESTPTATRASRSNSTPSTTTPLTRRTFSKPNLFKLPSYQARPKHRHSTKIDSALDSLKSLSEQANSPNLAEVEHKYGKHDDIGIIGNLESWGWVYHGSKAGVRIFSQEDDGHTDEDEFLVSATSPTTRKAPSSSHVGGGGSFLDTPTGTSNRNRRQGGVRSDESMPYFRGETWIDGSWSVEDFAATVRSYGARAIWDPRFGLSSSVVAALSETDTLTHMYIKGSFPVGDRDACLVSTFFQDPKKEVGFVASRSVEDGLIPKLGTRSTIHLNGFCIRALPRSPYFEPPPPPPPDESSPPPVATPTRPQHRRSKSSMSMGLAAMTSSPTPAVTPLALFEPLQTIIPSLNRRQTYTGNTAPSSPPPPPSSQQFPSQERFTSAGAPATRGRLMSHSSSYGGSVFPAFDEPLEYTINAPDVPVATVYSQEVSNRPGLHVTFIIRASPGGNLPQTYVNQLSLNLPLSLASIDRYLVSYGFAPHISQRSEGLQIREENFDASSGRYELVYKVGGSPDQEDTRIRFWGSTFSKGRFIVEFSGHAQDWKIEYDVEPDEPPTIERHDNKNNNNNNAVDPGLRSLAQRKSSLSILASPPLLQTGSFSRSGPENGVRDAARQCGPKGGCTLVVPISVDAVVRVVISKNADQSFGGTERTRFTALGEAARASLFEGTQCETIEDLLDSSQGDGWALASLALAKGSLRRIHRGKQREEEALARGGLSPPPTRLAGAVRLPESPKPRMVVGGRKRSQSVTLSGMV